MLFKLESTKNLISLGLLNRGLETLLLSERFVLQRRKIFSAAFKSWVK